MSADPASLTRLLKAEARRLGFDLAGATPAVTPQGVAHLARWLEQGYAGQMEYLSRRRAAYEHPRHVLDGCRSLLMLSFPYRTLPPGEPPSTRGRIARYAWGQDYHDLLRGRLNRLADYLRELVPQAAVRGVVDTAPLLEGEFAQLAGLGWIGKNTLLLNTERGSYFFLAALLTDQELEYDAPHAADHCGTCTACLDACPTGAFVEPYTLDARKCISYLTIELKTDIPAELRPLVGRWVFGCDICQEVCPWNRRAPRSEEPALQPPAGATSLELCGLFLLDDAAFRGRFRWTPLWRPRRRGLLRNAAIVLGNRRPAEGVEALARGLADPEPLVRGACAWALGRYQSPAARALLLKRSPEETDPQVRAEIIAALDSAPLPRQEPD